MRTLLRLIAGLITRMLGVDEEAERADMHLSNHALGLAGAALLAVFILVARYIYTKEWFYLVLGGAFLLCCIGILLCYRNQRIYLLSDEEFQYSTFLGNKKIYRFDEITALRKNRDSLTLFLGKSKVHIESSAVMSDKLRALIIEQFKKQDAKE